MKFAFGLACVVALGMVAGCGGEESSAEMQKEVATAAELSSSCAGIMPPANPASWTHSYSVDSDSDCGLDTSDASGNVMLGRIFGVGAFANFDTDRWDIFTGTGHARGSVQQFNGTWIFPQPWGLVTLGDQNRCGFNPSCNTDFELAAWTADGALIRRTPPSFDVWNSQVDPAGGVVLAGLRQPKGFEIVAQRFDARANAASTPAVVAIGTTRPTFIRAAVSATGLTLVLWNGDFSGFPAHTVVGRWLDRLGHARTGTFLVSGTSGDTPTPLVDGSMAIRGFTGNPASSDGEAWVAIVRGGSTAVSAVPSWLATRPDARVFIVRGGRAYALLFPIDRSSCGPVHVALFAPAGNRCGGFDVDVGSPGSACPSKGNIGRDGTLIVGNRLTVGQPSCKDRVFPALLR
jgi:hypothetical protein